MSVNSYQSKKLVCSTLLPTLFFGLSQFTYAANWYVEPSIGIETGYDDNPLLLSTDSTSLSGEEVDLENQSYLSFNPTILIATETERSALRTTLTSNIRRYNDSSLDSELFDITTGYRRRNLTNEIGFDLSYSEDSTIQTEFSDTGEFELDVDRSEFSFSPIITTQISTIFSSEASLSFRKVSFDSMNTDLTEFEETGASVGLTHATTERLDLSGTLSAIQFKPTGIVLEGEVEKENSYALVFGAEYSLKENLVLQMSIGPQYTESFLAGDGGASIDSDSILYDLGFRYTGFASSFNGSVSRTIESSALGGLIETDSYLIGWSRPEVYGGALGSNISFSTRDDDEAISARRDLYEFQMTYEKPLSRVLQYTVLYRYRKEDFSDEIQGGESNAITFQLRYNFARKSFSN